MDESMRRTVKERAGHACEYCRMPEAFYQTRFEIDHIIAQQHEGPTVLSNLALSCLHCNGHKGPNLTGIDPRTKKTTPLFHPRRHKWSRHFRWAGPFLIGLTAIGRTTIQVLAMNDLDLVRVREELIEEGVFPP